MQVDAGSVGIACQTVDEAATMVAAGFGDIMITNSLVDGKKLSRFLELAKQASMSLTADSDEAIEELARLAAASGQKASVYVECDIGGRRTGFTDPDLAAAFAVRTAVTN